MYKGIRKFYTVAQRHKPSDTSYWRWRDIKFVGLLFHNKDGITDDECARIAQALRQILGANIYTHTMRRSEDLIEIQLNTYATPVPQLAKPNDTIDLKINGQTQRVNLHTHFNECLAPFKEMGGCAECPLFPVECLKIGEGAEVVQSRDDLVPPDVNQILEYRYISPHLTTSDMYDLAFGKRRLNVLATDATFEHLDRNLSEVEQIRARAATTRYENQRFRENNCANCLINTDTKWKTRDRMFECGLKRYDSCSKSVPPLPVLIDNLLEQYGHLLRPSSHGLSEKQFWQTVYGLHRETRMWPWHKRQRVMLAGFTLEDGRVVPTLYRPIHSVRRIRGEQEADWDLLDMHFELRRVDINPRTVSRADRAAVIYSILQHRTHERCGGHLKNVLIGILPNGNDEYRVLTHRNNHYYTSLRMSEDFVSVIQQYGVPNSLKR